MTWRRKMKYARRGEQYGTVVHLSTARIQSSLPSHNHGFTYSGTCCYNAIYFVLQEPPLWNDQPHPTLLHTQDVSDLGYPTKSNRNNAVYSGESYAMAGWVSKLNGIMRLAQSHSYGRVSSFTTISEVMWIFVLSFKVNSRVDPVSSS